MTMSQKALDEAGTRDERTVLVPETHDLQPEGKSVYAQDR